MAVAIGLPVTLAGATSATLAPSGDLIELELLAPIGPQKAIIPVHRGGLNGTIRYFSAGIGQAERDATYPPFSLKVVLTAGGASFVTGVDLTLRNAQGATVLTIPGEQITGPWLFVDLPEGRYDIVTALGGREQRVQGLVIKAGRTTIQHVRWAEDTSPRLPPSAR